MSRIARYLNNTRKKIINSDEEIKSSAELIKALSKICAMQSEGTCAIQSERRRSDPTAAILIKIEKLKKKRDNAVTVSALLVDELTDMFEALPQPLQATMCFYYILGYSWEKVAELCDVSTRAVFERRKKAIELLSEKR